jgi:hypothetical protein
MRVAAPFGQAWCDRQAREEEDHVVVENCGARSARERDMNEEKKAETTEPADGVAVPPHPHTKEPADGSAGGVFVPPHPHTEEPAGE